MESCYYKVTALVIGSKPLSAIRRFNTDSYDEVYRIVKESLLKQYAQSQIIKIDVWWMSPNSDEVREYLRSNPVTSAKQNGG